MINLFANAIRITDE